MADNIGGEKRVDTGPGRKGECIVYSTPPSSRLVPVGDNVAEDYRSPSLLLGFLTTDLILFSLFPFPFPLQAFKMGLEKVLISQHIFT